MISMDQYEYVRIAHRVYLKSIRTIERETGLAAFLEREEIDRIVAGGMMSHICVDATVRAASDAGYKCLLAHDACAARDSNFDGVDVSAKRSMPAFMAALDAVYAQVASTEKIINILKP